MGNRRIARGLPLRTLIATVAGVLVAPVLAPVVAAQPPALRLEVVSGGCQVADVTRDFSTPLVVRAIDQDGRPVAGVPVRFATLAASDEPTAALGDGRGAPVVTDGAGRASIHAVAGPRAGWVTVVASASGIDDPVRFTLLDRPPASVVVESGDGATTTDAGPYGAPLVARVLGTDGSPLAGVPVRFELAAIDEVSAPSRAYLDGGDAVDVRSDADGRAVLTATSNGRPGVAEVRARAVDQRSDDVATFRMVTDRRSDARLTGS